ncbi:hypothetical protein [Gelidibacter mesophilus]|uniref:hypothetical protein n=1 Tax=Gelidibacter mesophilus TaxID=169050 RepID=UPI0004186FAA|nr:hypothetical protein [Gelidibacter mesophilus]
MRIQIFTAVICFFIINKNYAQVSINNHEYFDEFFGQEGKNLLLLGENHSSSVATSIYPHLIKSFNEKTGLRTLFIEFGPAEAYFYNKYLATGNESLLGYTIYGGFYEGWKEAWREIFEFNKTLEQPLEVIGVDFDRTRTFGYTLYSILQPYQKEGLPNSIDSLLAVIKDDKFFKTYTIDHPSDEGKLFVKNTKSLLVNNLKSFENLISIKDMRIIQQLINNKSTGFGGTREEDIKTNLVNHIDGSDENDFLFLVGRDHTYLKAIYDDNPRLAKFLKSEKSFNTLTGLVLHENSEQWLKGFKETVTLFEVKDKIPWKEYHEIIYKQITDDFNLIELNNELEGLSMYTDYLLVARNQEEIKI